MIDILDALAAITPEPTLPPVASLENGLDSISDAVFSVYLANAGVSEETISWRLREDVSLRESVIKMYESGEIKFDKR